MLHMGGGREGGREGGGKVVNPSSPSSNPPHTPAQVRNNMIDGRNAGVMRVRHKFLLTGRRHLVRVRDEFRYWFTPVPGTSYR